MKLFKETGIIAFWLIVFWACLIGALKLGESRSCYAKWSDKKNISAVEYTFFGGCMITLKDGQTIPEDNYRVVEGAK